MILFKFFIVKEFKKFPFFFILLFLTMLSGTLGVVGINIVSNQVQDKLSENAKELLTSDIAISARRELFPEERDALQSIFKNHSHEHYKIIDIYSMVTMVREKASRLAEVRSTEDGFPFFGKIQVEGSTFDPNGLYVSKDLASLWQVKIGEELQVGSLKLKIAGVVMSDSSLGLRGFSLAPRIYFPLKKLADTELLKPGATGSFSYHFKLKDASQENLDKIKKEIYSKIKDSAVKITLPVDSSDQTARVINIITNFMSLSALIGFILSLVGVFYLYQSHLVTRLKDLSLLHLHGLQKKSIIAGLVLQISTVFLSVVALEVLLVLPLYKILTPFISKNLGIELSPEINLSSLASDIPMLYALSLLILIPLLVGLMRTPMISQLKSSRLLMGNFRTYDFAPFLLSLWLFSCYLAHSFKIGNIFFGSIIIVSLLSTLIVKGAQHLIRLILKNRGLRTPTIEVGIALRSLTRSGHKLTASFLSLALGATLISLVLQLDKMILSEFEVKAKRPSLFIFDIQEDQAEPLVKYSEEMGSPIAFLTPMIRGRLEKVNDKKFIKQKKSYEFRSRDEDEDARFRSNGLNLTYRDYLTDADKIVEGEPFAKNEANEDRLPYVSVEKRWSERMNVSVGDKLTFDIQGVEFEGMVRNIREVKWTSFYPNFFVIIEPGMISAAPKTFLAILPNNLAGKKFELQRKAIDKFPNVSFVDVEEIVGKVQGIFEKAQKAIEIISWLSLVVGLVILYGLSHDQVYRRYYDLALMKSLGLSSSQLRLNLLFEFGILFSGAMGLGIFLGWLIAQLIGREVFKLPFGVDLPMIIFLGVLLTVLCLATILVSSWRAVRARPRELLSDA